MAKQISWKDGLKSVLFWSIISAAFIGPGTVTTAAKAGASFQLSLLWALFFSIIATMVLQEAAARLTIASGKNLGEIIALKYQDGQTGKRLQMLVFLAVAIGCAAYQAGNMLGALLGISLLWDVNVKVATFVIALICAALLWIGNFRIIANLLGLIVALMGFAFLYAAFQTDHRLGNVIAASVSPSIPTGSSLLIIGLIGTTIVPYNLFLASGISKGQSIKEMRIGIILAVLIGGLTSMAILLVGTNIEGVFSFEALASTLGKQSTWLASFFAFGLFAAGMSSSITSPLAAAVTARSVFSVNGDDWSPTSARFKSVWGGILAIGLLFGLLNVKPIPAIILAQAINGVLLPLVATFLLLAVNDQTLIPEGYRNSKIQNILFLLIVGITGFLGLKNVLQALGKTISALTMSDQLLFYVSGGGAVLVMLWLVLKINWTQSNT